MLAPGREDDRLRRHVSEALVLRGGGDHGDVHADEYEDRPHRTEHKYQIHPCSDQAVPYPRNNQPVALALDHHPPSELRSYEHLAEALTGEALQHDDVP